MRGPRRLALTTWIVQPGALRLPRAARRHPSACGRCTLGQWPIGQCPRTTTHRRFARATTPEAGRDERGRLTISEASMKLFSVKRVFLAAAVLTFGTFGSVEWSKSDGPSVGFIRGDFTVTTSTANAGEASGPPVNGDGSSHMDCAYPSCFLHSRPVSHGQIRRFSDYLKQGITLHPADAQSICELPSPFTGGSINAAGRGQRSEECP